MVYIKILNHRQIWYYHISTGLLYYIDLFCYFNTSKNHFRYVLNVQERLKGDTHFYLVSDQKTKQKILYDNITHDIESMESV